MQAIVNTAPGRLDLLDLPAPQPRRGEVRIRTGAVGICATDLEMIAGWERTGFPATPGHEWCGTVDATGDGVDPALIGQRCVAENVWADGGEVGFEHPGGYGQYFVTQASNVRALPLDFPFTTGILIEPLAVCVRALHRLGGANALAQPPAGPILIVGDGPIGLLLTMLLSQAGAQDIVLTGGREGRLTMASHLGARQTVNYHALGDSLATGIRSQTGMTFRTLFEASGSPKAMNAALELAANEANVVVIGDYGHTQAAFRWNLMLHQELRLIGSNASAGAWPEAVEKARQHQALLSALVTQRFAARDYQAAFRVVRSRDASTIKVALEWE